MEPNAIAEPPSRLDPELSYRSLNGNFSRLRAEGDAENVYRYEFTASSADKVRIFGRTYEVLNHSPASVRMGWMNSGNAPLLWMHDRYGDPDGVIESARLDGNNIKVIVRMSPNATKRIADIEAGVLKNVSIGYRIFADQIVSRNEETGETVWEVTDWEPYEVSFVTIPADPSVGLGRAAARSAAIGSQSRDRNTAESETNLNKQRTMSENNTPTGAPSITVVDAEKQRTDAVTAERNRVAAITAANNAAREANLGDFTAVADEHIREGKDVAAFQAHVLGNVRKTPGVSSRDLGLSDKEAKRYSFENVIAGLRDGDYRDRCSFEMEVSRAIQQKLDRPITEGRLAIPTDVMLRGYMPRNLALQARMAGELGQRNLNTVVATTGALSETGNQAGAHLLSNDLLTDLFIESLREQAIILALGVTMLPGLQGNVRIPREITNPAFHWVAEDRAPTAGAYDLDEIALSFKTLAASVAYTRQMMKQSTPNIENLLLNNLRRGLALAIDNALLNGTGSSNQPRGILATSGIGAVTSGGSPSYSNLIELWGALSDASADMSRARLVTNTLGAKRLLETPIDAGSGKFLAQFTGNPNQVLTSIGLADVTNLCPADSMLYGDFHNLFVGMWGGLEIAKDTATKAATGGVVLRFFQDLDCVVGQAGAFAAIGDIE